MANTGTCLFLSFKLTAKPTAYVDTFAFVAPYDLGCYHYVSSFRLDIVCGLLIKWVVRLRIVI